VKFLLLTRISFVKVDLREKNLKRFFEAITPHQFETIDIIASFIPQMSYSDVVRFLINIKNLDNNRN
jgi:hypothetical protein